MHNNIKSVGFTIVELLVVIVVIGVLAAITVVSYTGISQKATISSLQSDLSRASTLLKLDQVLGGNYPTSLSLANEGKGVSFSPDITYRYAYNNKSNPQSFCLTIKNDSVSYRVTNDSAPVPGDCFNYGLVLYLDGENNTSYPGSGTAWTDLSDNGVPTSLMGGVTYIPGDHGAFSFDGVDDYVNLSNVNRSSLSNCTVAFWRKSVDTTRWLLLGGQTSAYYLMAINVTGAFYHSNVGGPITIYEDGNPVTVDNRNNAWHYYVATGVNLSAWTALYLNNYSSWQYKGLLQDFRIYNRQLSPTEIQQNFTDTRNRFGI